MFVRLFFCPNWQSSALAFVRTVLHREKKFLQLIVSSPDIYNGKLGTVSKIVSVFLSLSSFVCKCCFTKKRTERRNGPSHESTLRDVGEGRFLTFGCFIELLLFS